MKSFLIFLNIFILASCSELTRTKDELTQNAQVYAEDALKTLEIARNLNTQNSDVNQRSVAQIVFPKAVKGSFIFGGNYAEGYLIENEQIIDQIRMIGGKYWPEYRGPKLFSNNVYYG